MESGKIFGSNEDARSCESGWTMYLASPSQDHADSCYYDDEEDSDGGDSMESDASSGPMEATSCLKLHKEVEEQNSLKKKKKTKEVVSVETTRVHNINHDDDDDGDGDNHDYDYGDGNDNYSAVHSYVVGSVRHEGLV